MTDEQKPPVSPELVDHLASVFPDRCPHFSDTNRTIWMAAGAVEVVTYLRRLSEVQHTTVFPTEG